MNNTGFLSPSTSTNSLFSSPLDSTDMNVTNDPTNNDDNAGQLLWNNVNTFSIPDDDNINSNSPHSTNNNATNSGSSSAPILSGLRYANTKPLMATEAPSPTKDDSTAFNISWGGNDKPPGELHPVKQEEDQAVRSMRPLPKPRGIRKLPEPEPAEDGTIDEDTLKRRKNTDAARKSRMKKFLKIDQLENRVAALQAENAKLTLNNAVLEAEKRSMNAKENEYKKRIKYLEDTMMCQGWDFETGLSIW